MTAQYVPQPFARFSADLVIEKRLLGGRDTLSLHTLAPGGFAVRFAPAKPSQPISA